MASSVLRSHFRSFGFPRSFLPGFPCILSRFRYSASLYVSFHPSLIRSHSCLSGAYLPLTLPVFSVPPPLPFSRFCFPSGYSASASFFLPSGPSPHSWLFVQVSVSYVPDPFHLHPRLVSRPLPSGYAYSSFCSFPFVLPCFTPTAVPQVLPFWISPPGSVPDFRFLSSASIVASHYSAYCSSFPHFPAPPHSGFPSAPLPLSLSRFSPFVPAWFPMPCSRFSYSASCLFPFVLPSFAPTAVPLVLPFWITPRGSTHDFHVLSSASVLASHYSASVSSFPRFPFPPHSGFRGARPFLSSLSLSPSVPPVSMLPFRFRYSASLLFLSPLLLFRVTGATLSAAGLLFPARPFPLAFALGSGYLACRFELFGSPQTSHILPLKSQKVNTYFVHF